MKKRWLVIIFIGVLFVLSVLTLIGALLVKQVAPVTPEVRSTPTAEPSASESPHHEADGPHFHLGIEDVMAFERETAENPLLSRLPHDTPYWSLEFRGTVGGTWLVRAVIHGDDSQTRDQMIAAQRPHIEAFVAGTGQRAGSYTLEYHTITVVE